MNLRDSLISRLVNERPIDEQHTLSKDPRSSSLTWKDDHSRSIRIASAGFPLSRHAFIPYDGVSSNQDLHDFELRTTIC